MAQNSEGTASKRRRGPGRPFEKGRSGNPGGRPKTKVLSTRLREALEENDGRIARWIIARLVLQSAGGAVDATKLIFDRTEGKVAQRHEIDYVRREAERLAEKYGLDPDDVMREAETILKERP